MAKKKLVKKKKLRKRVRTPIAVLTADTHLHPTTWANRPTLTDDSFNAFTQIVQYCDDHHIKDLVIAGDVLDRRVNDAETPRFIRESMERAQEQGTRVYYIQGQHDLQTDGTPWLTSVSNWPIHLHRSSMMLGDHHVYGIDWTRPSSLQEEIDLIPDDTNILVMHQVCVEFMGGIRECELAIATLPHARLLLIGDYHVHEQKQLSMMDGRQMLALSPGSTSIQKIDEEPAKRFYVLHDDLSVKSVLIKGRRVLASQRLHTYEDVDEFVENVEDAIDAAVVHAKADGLSRSLLKPILRVEYAEDLEGVSRRISRAVGPDAFIFEKRIKADGLREDSTVMAGDKARKLMTDAGLAGFLPRVLDRKVEKKLFAFCSELLDSQLPLDVIESWRRKFGITQEEVLDE